MSKSDSTVIRSAIDVIGFLILSLVIIIQSIIKSVLPSSYQRYKSIKGEIALITGGGGGLGRLLALRLAKLEAIVVVWDINAKAVEETINLVKGIGGIAYGYKCDLSKREDVYKAAKKTTEDIGDVSILINNAGVVSGKLLLQTPDDLIQRTFEVNALAHFWTVKAFLPKMIEKDHGHIVTIASMAGFVGINKLVDYCSSKHAAVGFTEALKIELETLGAKGVKTSLICPYFMQATGMFDNVNSRFLSTLKSNDVADRIVEGIRKEELLVLMPSLFKFGLVLKAMVPWTIISMFLRNLVPDAAPPAPTPTNPVSKSVDNHDKVEKTNNHLSNTMMGVNQRLISHGKNL